MEGEEDGGSGGGLGGGRGGTDGSIGSGSALFVKAEEQTDKDRK